MQGSLELKLVNLPARESSAIKALSQGIPSHQQKEITLLLSISIFPMFA